MASKEAKKRKKQEKGPSISPKVSLTATNSSQPTKGLIQPKASTQQADNVEAYKS